jgi:hypothetical protein
MTSLSPSMPIAAANACEANAQNDLALDYDVPSVGHQAHANRRSVSAQRSTHPCPREARSRSIGRNP